MCFVLASPQAHHIMKTLDAYVHEVGASSHTYVPHAPCVAVAEGFAVCTADNFPQDDRNSFAPEVENNTVDSDMWLGFPRRSSPSVRLS
jgi:hypothetical protein